MIGIGEDGLDGLSDASRRALDQAEIVFGGPRHLELAGIDGRGQPWPVPFSVQPVLEQRGRRVAVLASGDPFWHGVGGTLASLLERSDWQCFPAPSCMSLAAAEMGWRLEHSVTLALHAAPFEQLLPHLAPGAQILCTLRDGDAPAALAEWLSARDLGATHIHVLEALGGPRQRGRSARADDFDLSDIAAPVVVALEPSAALLFAAPGRPIDLFAHHGQITKPPMRALTLAALAPRPGELLWDIGAGSGSVSVEWALAAPGARSCAIEPRADRCDQIRDNAARFGLSTRVQLVPGQAPEALADLPTPQAVFIGGGVNAEMLQHLWQILPRGTRLVANAVTLDSQALLITWHGTHGGELLKIDLAHAVPLGRMQGWQAVRGQLQWSVTR